MMAESIVDESILEIPRRFGGVPITYTSSTLPEADVIISELSGEHCKANIWYNFALAYYNLKRFDEFQNILEKSIEFGKKEHTSGNSDILKLHDALTSYQILRGCKETEKIKRSQYFAKAMEHLNHGDEIFKYDENHLLQRGFYLLYEGQRLDHAEAQFKFITNTNEENIPGLVGYACVLYNKKDYSKSLQLFKKVLKMCPNCPPYVRLGIGYCLFKLGYLKKARVAFERVLELDENNSYALTALSVLDFNVNTLESTTAGANRLIKSWKIDSNNVSTALELADFLFLKGNYDKSEKYSKIAFQLAESPSLKGKSHYLVGRIHHQKNEIDLAIKHYNMASDTCGPEFLNPLFGLGQSYVMKKDFEKAIEYFEKVLVHAPDDGNTKKALIMMYIRSPGKDPQTKDKRTASIRQYFSELLVNENLYDPLLVIEHARFVEKTNFPLALQEISRIIDVYRKSNDSTIPIELLNNYGVYLYMNNVYIEANTIFSECLSRVNKEFSTNNSYAGSLQLTFTFNSARTKEELGYTDIAVKMYKQLLIWKPDYNEANLRLGKISEKQSDFNSAGKYYQEIICNDPQNFEALVALGNLHMQRRNYLEAQKKFEAILKSPHHKNNAYPNLALGIIWLEQLYKPNRNKDKDNENISRAFEMFSKVLKTHSRNVYAGNCMGVLLTFIGCYEEARECFSEVRQTLFNEKGPWLNLAHVFGMLKNYHNAIRMYQTAIEKFGLGKDSDVLLALGRMYWKNEEYNNSMDYMLQAVTVDPLNLYAKYNLGKIYVKLALNVMGSPNQSLIDLDKAISYFNEAKCAFNDVRNFLNSSSDIKIKWKYINIGHLSEEISMCEDYLTQANSKRPKIVEIERLKEETRKRQKEIMIKLEEEKIAQMKIQESREFERQNRLRDLRNEFLNMNKDALKVSITDDKKRANIKGENSKRKKGDDLDGFVASDDEYIEENEKRRKKRKTRKSRRIIELSDDDDDEDDQNKEKEEDVDLEVDFKSNDVTYLSTEDNNAMEKSSKDESLSSPDPTPVVFGPCTDDSSSQSSN